jgi:hypothetical protein
MGRPEPKWFRQGWVLLLMALAGWWGQLPLAAAETAHIEEYQLKAAFLPRFPLFVEWPVSQAPTNAPELVIGVLGQNPFGPHLELACQGKTVGGRKLVTKTCQSLAEAKTCQVVFIAASEKERLPEILAGLTRAGVLTVGDLPQFAEAGGMIGLVTDQRKIRMEINMEAVREGGLRIDPQLLQMARVIQSGPPAAPAKT